MKALVTGANGFIGRHIVEELDRQGWSINVLVRNNDNLFRSKNIRIFEGNILDKDSLSRPMNDVEVVFHLIGKTHDFSKNGNSDYLKINVDGTGNLLEQCRRSGIKHFVFFSSIKAMTEESREIIDETFYPSPSTPYGTSKLEAEKLVSEYGRKYGFKTTSIRLPLVYGPGNKGNMFRIIKAIDKGRFIMVGRGKNCRSMVHVHNVVDAAVKIAGNEKADGKVYIVTDGVDYPVKQLYETIARGLSKKVSSIFFPMSFARPLALAGNLGSAIIRRTLPFNTDVLNKLTESLVFSSRKIQEEIGFTPKYNLFNTIHKTVEWYRENR